MLWLDKVVAILERFECVMNVLPLDGWTPRFSLKVSRSSPHSMSAERRKEKCNSMIQNVSSGLRFRPGSLLRFTPYASCSTKSASMAWPVVVQNYIQTHACKLQVSQHPSMSVLQYRPKKLDELILNQEVGENLRNLVRCPQDRHQR